MTDEQQYIRYVSVAHRMRHWIWEILAARSRRVGGVRYNVDVPDQGLV